MKLINLFKWKQKYSPVSLGLLPFLFPIWLRWTLVKITLDLFYASFSLFYSKRKKALKLLNDVQCTKCWEKKSEDEIGAQKNKSFLKQIFHNEVRRSNLMLKKLLFFLLNFREKLHLTPVQIRHIISPDNWHTRALIILESNYHSQSQINKFKVLRTRSERGPRDSICILSWKKWDPT